MATDYQLVFFCAVVMCLAGIRAQRTPPFEDNDENRSANMKSAKPFRDMKDYPMPRLPVIAATSNNITATISDVAPPDPGNIKNIQSTMESKKENQNNTELKTQNVNSFDSKFHIPEFKPQHTFHDSTKLQVLPIPPNTIDPVVPPNSKPVSNTDAKNSNSESFTVPTFTDPKILLFTTSAAPNDPKLVKPPPTPELFMKNEKSPLPTPAPAVSFTSISPTINRKTPRVNDAAGRPRTTPRSRITPSKYSREARPYFPTTPRPVVCHNQNFQSMSDCCKEDTGVFFDAETRHKCYVPWDLHQFAQSSRDYVLNLWQTARDNQLDLSSNSAQQRQVRRKCYVECLFKAQNLVVNESTLNLTSISSFFNSSVSNAVSRPVVERALTTCNRDIADLDLPTAREKCSILPFLYLQCLRRQILLTCTLPEIIPSKSTKTFAEMCDTSRKLLRMCDVVFKDADSDE